MLLYSILVIHMCLVIDLWTLYECEYYFEYWGFFLFIYDFEGEMIYTGLLIVWGI